MNKCYILFLCIVGTVGVSQAQQLIVYPNDSAEITANVTDEFEPNDIHIGLINNTGAQVTVTWGMVNYVAPPQWEVKLCDNNNCYDLILGPGPYESLPVDAGDTLDMKFQYTAHLVTGSASTNVYAYVTNDSTNSVVILNYKASLIYAGLSDLFSKELLEIYPNPVRSSVSVSGLKDAENLSFSIYDLKGAAMNVKAIRSTSSMIEISTENLPAGDYVLQVLDPSGKTIGSSRLNKVD